MSTTRDYVVQGMTCNSCAAKVTSAVTGVAGVSDATVDLATGTLTVAAAEASDGAVSEAIIDAGYRIS